MVTKSVFAIIVAMLWHVAAFADSRNLSADSLAAIGAYYYKQERYIDAMDVLAQAMDKADQTGNDGIYVASLMKLGNIYTLFDDYEQALHCYNGCLEKKFAQESDSVAARIKSNMLLCYAKLGMREEAEKCYRSIGTLRMGSDNLNRLYTYINQALLMKVRKYYKGAIFFHTQAMQYALDHDMNGLYAAAEMGQIGTVYEESGDMKSAEEWYLKCKDFAEKGRFIGPLTTTYERLAGLYRKMGNASLSMKYNRLHVEYTDSFFRQKDYNSKRSLVNSYENRLKDRRMSALKEKNTTLTWVIATICMLMAVLIVLLIYIYRVNRRLIYTQRLLIKKHQEHSHQLEVQNEIFASFEHEHAADTADAGDEEAAESTEDGIGTWHEADGEKDATEEAGEETVVEEDNLLSKKQADKLLMEIARIMEDTHTVCNPDFSLSMLAQKVKSNTKYVSWVINKSYGKNFKTYLNEYRIRTASQILADSDKVGSMTIAGIAEAVGYKSPASFHLAFKKIYGMTPAAYVKLARTKDE